MSKTPPGAAQQRPGGTSPQQAKRSAAAKKTPEVFTDEMSYAEAMVLGKPSVPLPPKPTGVVVSPNLNPEAARQPRSTNNTNTHLKLLCFKACGRDPEDFPSPGVTPENTVLWVPPLPARANTARLAEKQHIALEGVNAEIAIRTKQEAARLRSQVRKQNAAVSDQGYSAVLVCNPSKHWTGAAVCTRKTLTHFCRDTPSSKEKKAPVGNQSGDISLTTRSNSEISRLIDLQNNKIKYMNKIGNALNTGYSAPLITCELYAEPINMKYYDELYNNLIQHKIIKSIYISTQFIADNRLKIHNQLQCL